MMISSDGRMEKEVKTRIASAIKTDCSQCHDKAAAKESAGYQNECDEKNSGSEQIGQNEK